MGNGVLVFGQRVIASRKGILEIKLWERSSYDTTMNDNVITASRNAAGYIIL